jgi:molybdenum cofactor cytidylyltransferase
MGASLAHAVGSCAQADGWVVALGDMPNIDPRTIALIADKLRDGALIAAPCYRGARGHPVGFSALLRDELSALSGDAGARDVLRAHKDQVVLIECDDPGVLADIDTPADLARIGAREH